MFWAVTAVVVVLCNSVTCRVISRRNDDVSPNDAVIQAMAARLTAVEAELSAQKQKVKVLEDQLSHKVAFTAQMADGTSGNIPNGGPIPFNKVTLNVGQGYNPSTLSFTAPYDGAYWFYARVDEGSLRAFEIRRNGKAVNRCDNDLVGMRSITCGVVVTLSQGDSVTVNHVDLDVAGGTVDPGPETLFAGFLIR